MKQGNQIPKSAWYRTAKEGQVLPLVYNGKILKIRRAGVELESAKLPYESKIHLGQALLRGEVEKFQPEGDKK